jgi:hypothetical protein
VTDGPDKRQRLDRFALMQTFKTIRTLISKGDAAADKAEQFYIAAGLSLKKLRAEFKADKQGDETWAQYVKKHCGIGIRRTQELIAIADGRTTLEKVRETKAESMRRLRQREQRGARPRPEEIEAHRARVQADWLAANPDKTREDFPFKSPWERTQEKWLSAHPDKTADDYDAVIADASRRELSSGLGGLVVAAKSLIIGVEADHIKDWLKHKRAEFDSIAPYLDPRKKIEVIKTYREAIIVAQDTRASWRQSVRCRGGTGDGAGAMTDRERLPDLRPSETFELEHVGMRYTVTISRDRGVVRECFISNHKRGNASDVAARDCGILISLCLQHGCPLDTIARALSRNSDGTASGVAGAVVDKIAEPKP